MLDAFLDCSPPCFLRQDLSRNLELPVSVKLVGQQDPGGISLCLPSTKIIGAGHSTWLLHGRWGFELRPSCLSSKHFTRFTAVFSVPL